MGLAAAATALPALQACSPQEPLPPGGPGGNGGGGTAAKEAPSLTQLVDSGQLPPLEERLPATPAVAQSHGSDAAYGGTLRRATLNDTDTSNLLALAGAALIEWSSDGKSFVEDVAESFEPSDDFSSYTIKLREGLKWSDGEPFTTADLMFLFEDWLGNKTMVPSAPYWVASPDKSFPTAEANGDFELTVTFSMPNPLWWKYLCNPAVGTQFLKPAHYLKEFHADYADKAALDAAVAEAGLDTWDKLFALKDNAWTNPDRPVLGAYVLDQPIIPSGTATMKRNPYYYKVDGEGRQLPYIDDLQIQKLDRSALDLRVSNGDIDFQGYGLSFGAAQVYLQNADANNYQIRRWEEPSVLGLLPNLSHADPVVRELFNLTDFRVAMSHAINRDTLNKTLLGGIGVVAQATCVESDEYWTSGVGEQYLEFDQAKAASLLDGIGAATGPDGTRVFKGKPLDFVIMYVDNAAGAIKPTEAYNSVVADLAKIGVKLFLRPVDSQLYAQSRSSNDFDFDGTPVPRSYFDLEPVWYIPTAGNSHTAPAFGNWYASGGTAGEEPTGVCAELVKLWDELRAAPSDQARISTGQAIQKLHSDECVMIGLVGNPFAPVVVSNTVKNVREDEPQLAFVLGRDKFSTPEQLCIVEG
ncbi:ABC transporter substrate-binding protein [Parenemella sanctibonifatiensis]|uniref:ABC transporter substrate-binding protein n=1 Tax=Parenemella sanctibonifatiensis TaxID=2016505 RepID=UPI0015C59C94|nr:ABC transporter substrate-binding protein [Parenemella sanctibonifatiensis]